LVLLAVRLAESGFVPVALVPVAVPVVDMLVESVVVVVEVLVVSVVAELRLLQAVIAAPATRATARTLTVFSFIMLVHPPKAAL
jgi:hypothetical protein